ncbi:MAG: hypothetical protein JXN59_19360 [Anaerolineae bacterium]|nr:hypothetical protein [Anaerolineae bacterium]
MNEKSARLTNWLPTATLALLLIAASRILRLGELIDLGNDEIWSIWQALGTPQQIIAWTPYDWPPLYFLLLGAWRALVGLHPEALRYSALLVFMLCSAIVFRLTMRLAGSRPAALLGMLAYGALGYAIFASLYVRGYMLVPLYAPLSLWLALRYFDRPTLRRALPLGITLALMFWTTLSLIGAFLALGLFTLVVYPRQVWRWWLPGLIAGALALPQIISKAALGTDRIATVAEQELPPLFEALGAFFNDITANAPLVWAAILILAAALLLWRGRFSRRFAFGALAWMLAPVLLYILNPILGLFSDTRYMGWVIVGPALWAALGLARLPRGGRLLAGALLAGLMFLPVSFKHYEHFPPPLGDNLAWLSEHMQAGDVVLLDPHCSCALAEEWDYYGRVYFPQGIKFVAAPEGHSRVWYVTWQSRQDPALEARVNAGREPGIFVGPPENLIRLYEGPPDATGIRFENGITFHGLEILDAPLLPVRHEGETLDLRLWWSTDTPLTADYSFSIQVFRGDALVLQMDGPAQIGGVALDTSHWEPGTFYADRRTLALPAQAPRGIYTIKVTVYQWWDNVRIPAPGVDENILLPVGAFSVVSW